MKQRDSFSVVLRDGKVRHLKDKGMGEMKEQVLLSKIRDRMYELGFTQEVVAKRIGVKQATVSAFLLGNHGMGVNNLVLLLTTLGLEIRPAK